jgi:hypothetical protein
MLVFIDGRIKKLFAELFFLFIFFLIGVLVYISSYDERYDLFYHLSIFNKYVYVFLIYCFLSKLREKPVYLVKLMSTCEFLFAINAVLAIIGLLLNIKLFRSYMFQDYRFGYNGIIPSVNESTLFYMIALSYLYHKKFVLRKPLHWRWIIVVGALLVGAKGIYFFMICLACYHLFWVSSIYSKVKSVLLLTILFCLGVFLFIRLNLDIFDHFVYLAEKNGFFSMLLTGRDLVFKNNLLTNLEYWGVLNYFFGGQDQQHFLLEMDFFDGLLFFGLLGFSLYFFMFFQFLFSMNLRRPFNLFFVGIYFLLAALGGHFFASALNGLYLAIFSLYLATFDDGYN